MDALVVKFLIITIFSVTYIYDVADFPRSFVARMLTRIFHREIQPHNVALPKVFECSLCATTWLTLITLVITSPWQWWWLCLPCGYATRYALSLINIADLLITTILILIERLLHTIKGN